MKKKPQLCRKDEWLEISDASSLDGTGVYGGSYPFSCPPFSFPADEGRHSRHPLEWWYFISHLTARQHDGERDYFVFLCWFSTGTVQVGITDLQSGERWIYAHQYPASEVSMSRGGMRLNFGGNTLETVAPFKYQSRFDARNDTARICVDLTYESLREPFPVNSGYFRYPGGGYTYYYTQGRLKTYGTIIVERENRRDSFECKAEGLSWVDRQWGRFTPFGTWRWEWMAIQAVLHGEGGPEWGRGLLDVNCWNLRKVSDNSVIWEMATAKLPDGRVLVGRVEMRALDYWESPNGHTYSHGWKVALIFNDATGSPMQLLLQVRPKIDDQTQESAPRLSGMLDQPREFWEGACDVYYKRVCIGVAAVELTHHYR